MCLTVNVPTGPQMCSLVSSLKHFRDVTEKGGLWRTPEWELHSCIPSVALAVTVLSMDGGFLFAGQVTKLTVGFQLCWVGKRRITCSCSLRRAECLVYSLQFMLKVEECITVPFQVWMFISEGLLQAFDNLCELLKLCICLNSIILVSIHHWFPSTEPLD